MDRIFQFGIWVEQYIELWMVAKSCTTKRMVETHPKIMECLAPLSAGAGFRVAIHDLASWAGGGVSNSFFF